MAFDLVLYFFRGFSLMMMNIDKLYVVFRTVFSYFLIFLHHFNFILLKNVYHCFNLFWICLLVQLIVQQSQYWYLWTLFFPEFNQSLIDDWCLLSTLNKLLVLLQILKCPIYNLMQNKFFYFLTMNQYLCFAIIVC